MASRTRSEPDRAKNDLSEKESSDSKAWTCVVCCQRVPGANRRAIYAIGVCDHVVCYECSTKLRVLCKQNECPICRRDLRKVIYTCNRHYKFDESDLQKCIHYNDEYQIYFQSEVVLEAYGKLLEHKCCLCKVSFKDLKELEKHLQKEHSFYLCDLCVEHLKVFSHERKYYSWRDLGTHKKTGDPDDTSHRGHPICRFCETRFFDDELLHKHLRCDHFFCHICDPSGQNKFFGTYSTLREHYKNKHFLCEEGACAEEQFTTVFKSEIDLQAHRAKMHCSTKLESKNARTLTLDLLVKPQRHRQQNSQSSLAQGAVGYSFPKKNQKAAPTNLNVVEIDDDYFDQSTQAPSQAIPKPEDFPELSASGHSLQHMPDPSTTSSSSNKSSARKNTFSARLGGGKGRFVAENEEEFPALCPMSASLNAPSSSEMSKKSMSSVAASFTMKNTKSKVVFPSDFPDKKSTLSTVNVISTNNKKSEASLPPQDFLANNEDFPELPVKQIKSKNRRKKKNATSSDQNNAENLSTDMKECDQSVTTIASVDKHKQNGQNVCENEEFPALPVAKENKTINIAREKISKPKPPPGLKRLSEEKAIPSHTASSIQPPPGYSHGLQKQKVDYEISLTSVAQQVINKAKQKDNISQSNGDYERLYLLPLDFNERNQALVEEVASILKDKFDFFKQISKEFRQGDISGEEYWKKCLSLFGKNNFSKIFGELLVLLPDIKKQNELLSLYENYQKQLKGAIPKRHSYDGLWVVKPDNAVNFLVCPTCRQILALKDGWYEDKVCLYNQDGNACRLGTLLGGIGLLASIALLAIEAFFQNLSSIKMRRRVVALDLAFSALWSLLYFICFVYLEIAWNQSPYPPYGYGLNSLRTAIVFSFFSVFVWAGCAYFAWLRWKAGADMSQFASGFEGEDLSAGYASYAAGADGTDVGYQEGMYTGPIDQFQGNYSAPTY
ncbi:zinc finger protein 598-like isoform X3 [Dinothrombium tinctorium]|uniref:RING-type E3 ubiquitin transferase n=1 Tax=Dinothrombium tinctorium TaxID=1965070 RepID=A0A3S3NXM4_9ACAR|nr:zinc finger protein 598-like isoform X3 [Dinothrombium tinctorium]RWS08009.1 zinc finger protein 598-like isoform X3 [Dinothrombium tinctorium]RWS08091.1 zinc finger protein 598-like isoform X3 [Dinothrombium tinctorium]